MSNIPNNSQIARLLKNVSAAYEVKGESRFRIAAYSNAAAAIEHAASREVKDLWDDGKLTEIPGIGPNIASHLDELFRKGKVAHFEKVMKNLPPAMFTLLEVPGIGAKTAYKLCRILKINRSQKAIAQLELAAQHGKIEQIEGFGKKSQQDILDGIRALKKGVGKENRMVLPYATAIAQEILDYLKKCPGTLRVNPLGSLRRKVATIGDIDIAVATNQPTLVINWFVKFPKVRKVIEKGPTGASVILENGRQLDLRVQKPNLYGAMLQYFTGSKQHNIKLRSFALKKGLSLSEYGIKKVKSPKLKRLASQDSFGIKSYASEEEFYNALGMDWIPPELREDTGEIEAALRHELPKLVKLNDIRGDLHMHSNFPIEESHDPGTSSILEMAKTAANLGYEYIGLAEHNPSQNQHSEAQIIGLIKSKKEAIDQLNYSRTNKLLKKIFNGLEIDIKPNGELAIPQQALEFLDYGIASIHSSFGLNRQKMTKRVLKGLAHPKIRIFGHPTGRKLGQREGYELDWEKIFDFCQRHNKWLEVNAWPDRLDLPDSLVREAIKQGVKIVINSDAHAEEDLRMMAWGVMVAQRGWAQKSDIVNTLPCGRIENMLRGGDI